MRHLLLAHVVVVVNGSMPPAQYRSPVGFDVDYSINNKHHTVTTTAMHRNRNGPSARLLHPDVV